MCGGELQLLSITSTLLLNFSIFLLEGKKEKGEGTESRMRNTVSSDCVFLG